MARRGRVIEIHRPVVVVMGASRGIGFEIAKQFASIGCEVCLCGRTKRELHRGVGEIVRLGGRARAYSCDVTVPASMLSVMKSIRKQIGEIDVLVNNAGVTAFKSFLDTTLKEFDEIIDTNLRGHIHCIKAVLPSMVKRNGGWIINIISTAAIKTFEHASAYTAAKAGMLGLAKVLREETRKHGVKVINILPGPTRTQMWSAANLKKHSRRMMNPKSVAEAVLAAYQMPDDVVVEEMVIRPVGGDL